MLKKLPLIISAIVFTVTLVTYLAFFHAGTGCHDIIGDGYAMGTDPEPVVIGQICGHPWQLTTDANDFTTHTILSTLIALTLGTVTWGIVWIACWKGVSILKKLGLTLLMLAFATIGFLATTAIVTACLGGLIYVDRTAGMIAALLCVLLSLIGSLMLIRVILRRKSKTKSSKRAR
jgi:magnesium-transporting ATPase (P-type)